MKKNIIFISLILALFAVSCTSKSEKKESTQSGTAFRKGSLYNENINLGQMPKEVGDAPGQNKTDQRAFENAPPLIPHNIDGFVPITLKNNMCLACHMPDKAAAVGATPLPATHFSVLRPKIKKIKGKYVLYDQTNKVEVKDLGGKLDMSRYNCTQCHVVQTDAKLDVKNLFKPDFRDSTSKHKSDLIENIDEGVK